MTAGTSERTATGSASQWLSRWLGPLLTGLVFAIGGLASPGPPLAGTQETGDQKQGTEIAPVDDKAGIAAFDAGDYATALAQLEPAARTGDPQAQFLLGRAYAEGLGTLKNYSLAHTWLTLAANQGIFDAMRLKMSIADNLSQRDIVESMRRQTEILGGPPGAVEDVAQPQPDAVAGAADADTDDGIDGLSRRELVRAIQEELNRVGRNAGTPDGLYGPTTRQAIEAFERQAGLNVTGEATPDLLRTLRRAGGN